MASYQRWAAEPSNYTAEVAATLGTTKMDEEAGRQRLDETGQINAHSTPWAKQMKEDIQALAEAQEETTWWKEADNNVLKLFDDPVLADMFVQSDPSLLRAQWSDFNHAALSDATSEGEKNGHTYASLESKRTAPCVQNNSRQTERC